ncbi:hypothetical protein [Microbacterium terregens]|uniref:DUF998 domain-containing protein n=1 Tax=Microbacterium terregens TaxID=69363 RepID=A0ABV5SWU5_9MICO
MWGRWVMALGGLLVVLITPAFALSYFGAYGDEYQAPHDWLAALQDPLVSGGALDPGSTAQYDGYGLMYLGAWVIGLVGLVGVVGSQWVRFTERLRRAWSAVIATLALVTVGVFGDYALPDEVLGFIGFVLTGVGFLAAAVMFLLLGRALRRELGTRRRAAWTVGALGIVSVFGGMALVGHIPSGPGLGFAVAALVAGLARPWRVGPERWDSLSIDPVD